ncbi:hypothetical protein E2562_034533 [Oryza meyeriana var. granulata]|uniref:Uncharacterized protein n=1 Tax=Oryza meyeriana var. granulata TaxID=110450 RepID=A0A6G1CC62_9ORYZ|nr:hypothetical protein E2562_034533 [Oryza meyeriana var. granulata]
MFVGRAERPRCVVRVMCAAAKQCVGESNMHMAAPWRKQRYMEAKWLALPKRVTGTGAVVVVRSPETNKLQPKFRACMLTIDFGGRTAVEVV